MISTSRLLDALRAAGHDAQSVRLKGGQWEAILRSGDQRAADAELAARVAAGPTIRDRIEAAARTRGLTTAQLALAAVTVTRADGQAPPSWALPILRSLVAGVSGELAAGASSGLVRVSPEAERASGGT